MFLDYCTLLNALDSGASAKITIHNRRIDKEDFERSVLLPLHGDDLDHYRENSTRCSAPRSPAPATAWCRERYLTVSIVKRNIDEAAPTSPASAQTWSRISPSSARWRRSCPRQTGCGCCGISSRPVSRLPSISDLRQHAKRGHSFKDWLCPDSMEFAADHFQIDARFGRVLYLQDYASYIKDKLHLGTCDP